MKVFNSALFDGPIFIFNLQKREREMNNNAKNNPWRLVPISPSSSYTYLIKKGLELLVRRYWIICLLLTSSLTLQQNHCFIKQYLMSYFKFVDMRIPETNCELKTWTNCCILFVLLILKEVFQCLKY